LGVQGGYSVQLAQTSVSAALTTGTAPAGANHSVTGGTAPGGSPARGGAASKAGGGLARGTLLDAIAAFEVLPEHQGETALAGLVALTLVLAGLQFANVARRRRLQLTVRDLSEEHIEGGEEL
jgi:hypothetical protein